MGIKIECRGKISSHQQAEREEDVGTGETQSKMDVEAKKQAYCSPTSSWKQFGITLAVSLLQLAGAVTFTYTGITLPSITDPNSGDFYMNTRQVSIYTSMILIGALFGSLLAGPLCNKLGQKTFMLMLVPIGLFGYLIMYFSNIFWHHLASRFILGIFSTSVITVSATFIAEIVNSNYRGKFLAITDLARQVGFLFVCLVGSTTLNWRVVCLVCGLTPLIIPSIVLLLIPNSPRWLAVRKHPEEDIRASLQYYRGQNADIDQELMDIYKDVGQSEKSHSSWHQFKLFREASLFKRIIILAYLHLCMNLTGNYAFLSFAVVIFQSAGNSINPYLSTVICGVVRVFGSVLCVLVSDHIGRRKMLLIFLSLCCLCTTTFGTYFYLEHLSYDTSGIFWVPLASMLCFQVFSSLSLPSIRLMRSELLPNNVRNVGANLVSFFVNVSSFITAVTYPLMVATCGTHWVFWFYSAVTVSMIVVIFFFLPETKGKSLEEIAKLF